MNAMAAVLTALLLSGCGALKALNPTVSPAPNLYSLGEAHQAGAGGKTPASGLTLTVSPPHAAAGFDSPRMMYQRQPGKLEYFAHNEWVDTPARMLAPLIVSAVERGGAYRAVVRLPTTAAGDLRLDTEILRLEQDFTTQPSQLRFTLRAYLVQNATRRVIATRDFEAAIAATADNPRGGADAARRAVAQVLERVSAFCADAARADARVAGTH